MLARDMDQRVVGFVEDKLERWVGLELNRDKTRVFHARAPQQTLDFLGYSFRWDRDLLGRGARRWRLFPSKQTMQRQRQWLRYNLNARHRREPLPDLRDRLNRRFRGWRNYFSLGHPRREFRQLHRQLQLRLGRHLQRRSQRGHRVPEGIRVHPHRQNLGCQFL